MNKFNKSIQNLYEENFELLGETQKVNGTYNHITD